VFALATVIATFGLLLVGGTVNPTGSSLACPDWPTCYGTFFPEMVDGVEYEHTHRIVATVVGLMTWVLAGWIHAKRKDDPTLRALGWTAAALVVIQGVLGGITVLLRLPLLVSTAHLALSMLFFALLIYITLRIWPHADTRFPSVRASRPSGNRLSARTWVGAATLLIYAQIILGAFVRHTKSGHACHDDWLLCLGSLWPTWPPAQLHMTHRFVGYLTMIAVMAVSVPAWRAAVRHAHPTTRWVAAAAPVLVLTQVALGLLTVATGIGLIPVTAHLGVGAMLLANFVVLYFALPARVPAAKTAPKHGQTFVPSGAGRAAT
ncbi:MAG: COX15/CtaA family protein, partial [Myxococcota bacterium]